MFLDIAFGLGCRGCFDECGYAGGGSLDYNDVIMDLKRSLMVCQSNEVKVGDSLSGP